jgi:hypothetical protein
MKIRILSFFTVLVLGVVPLIGACDKNDRTENIKPANTEANADTASKISVQKAVEDALKNKGFDDIKVEVKDKIILSGTVAKNKKQEAVTTAMSAGEKTVDASRLDEK